MKIAIVGAGIAGLGCAHALAREHAVTVYEAAPRLGGHTHTVDVTVDGIDHPVDTGFLVYNERTYPNLIRLFAELEVPVARSEMSFSVSVPAAGGRRLEWGGASLDTVFAQRRNLLSPRFVGMLREILRFNRLATAVALGHQAHGDATLGEFLDQHRFGREFRQWYLLPMAGAIWSCPPATMLGYPAATFIRFCHNHGLAQVDGQPRWFTVAGGARQYVDRIAARLRDVRRDDAVLEVVRQPGAHKVTVRSRRGADSFDQVVLACHSDQSLSLLADADADERRLLAGVGYQRNRAVLHTDARLLPQTRKTWSAWNYASSGGDEPAVAVTYLLNRLQPLPFRSPVMVSLNPIVAPRAERVIAEFDFAHPVFDRAAIDAQRRLADVQGRRRVWFAGAWTGYGFHEDGLNSGLAVAGSLRALGRRSALQAA